MNSRTFIPNDKPKFWVIGILAGLIGFGAGLVAFAATVAGINIIKQVFIAIFMVCWLTFAVSWFGCLIGFLSGRYRHLQSKPWSEQVW